MQVTLSKGGTKERKVNINSLQVPDLWHVAMFLKFDIHKMDRIHLDMNAEWFNQSAKSILECWHLCHDLLKYIQENES